jgi:hypothetical protein
MSELIQYNFLEIIKAIRQCIDGKFHIPALILIYTSIDSVSYLYRPHQKSVQKRFTTWVNDWLINKSAAKYQAIELYAARCAILHTLTSDSDLSKSKSARRISYCYGNKKEDDLQKILDMTNPGEFISLHIENLFKTFCNALIDFFNHCKNNSQLSQQLENISSRYFNVIDGDLGDLITKFIKTV